MTGLEFATEAHFMPSKKSIYQLKYLMAQYTYVDHKYAAVP